jgi:uncharacterized lipoprotein YddW (UPF0748 family)
MQTLTVIQNTVFKKAATSSSSAERVPISAGRIVNVKYAYRVGNHCFVELENSLGTVGRLGYFFLAHVKVKLDEVRGVWLTNVDSTVLNSRENIKTALTKLKKLGYNTLYPVVWNKGFTLYPSAIAKPLVGASVIPVAQFPDNSFENRDMLAELIELGRPMGFRIIPWFEYGLMVMPDSQIAAQHPEWITLDVNGDRIRTKPDGQRDTSIWMNPCHPGVQKFMTSLIAEVVEKYDIDGIQFDDHFGFPVEMGYDPLTQDLFRREKGFSAPRNHADPDWVNWASGKMTDLLLQVFRAVKAKRSSCLISLAPGPLGFSVENYMANWQAWDQQGLIEDCVIQLYRNSLQAFMAELDKPELAVIRNHIPTSIGISAGDRVEFISTELLRSQVEDVRRRQFAGASFFFYETVFFSKIGARKVPRSEAELQSVFPSRELVPIA